MTKDLPYTRKMVLQADYATLRQLSCAAGMSGNGKAQEIRARLMAMLPVKKAPPAPVTKAKSKGRFHQKQCVDCRRVLPTVAYFKGDSPLCNTCLKRLERNNARVTAG